MGKYGLCKLSNFLLDNIGFPSHLLSCSDSLKLALKSLLHDHSSSLPLPMLVTIILSIQWTLIMKMFLSWRAYIRISPFLTWHSHCGDITLISNYSHLSHVEWSAVLHGLDLCKTRIFGFQLQVSNRGQMKLIYSTQDTYLLARKMNRNQLNWWGPKSSLMHNLSCQVRIKVEMVPAQNLSITARLAHENCKLSQRTNPKLYFPSLPLHIFILMDILSFVV